jgi:hypothetical protein
VRGSTWHRFTSLPHVTKAMSQYPEKARNVTLIRIPVPSVFKIAVHWRLIELGEYSVSGKISVRSSAFEKCYVHSDCSLLDFPVTPCRVDSKLCPTFWRNLLPHLQSD